MQEHKRNKFSIIIAGLAVAIGIALTLFRHWEPSSESWGYWLFARIFAETGRFVIVSRGSLYVLYLNLFRGLGYPYSVIVEYISTSLILAVSLVLLFRRYLGLFWAVFIVILWLPFFQAAEPPIQNLALACCCLAIAARNTKPTRFRLALSYALFGFAYMFRTPYIIFIGVFATWDILKVFRQNNLKNSFLILFPKKYDWPILVVLVLLVWFSTMQSGHPWNNGWFATTRWFPSKGKTLSDASFIQNYNWYYIYYKYGTFKDKDFYFTNQEAFGGAKDMIGLIRANPRFVASQFIRQIKGNFSTIASFTQLPQFLYTKIDRLGYFYYVIFLFFTVPFVFAISYGALRCCKDKVMILFIIANILLIGVNALVAFKTRYMQPLIPILTLCAFWYGNKIYSIFSNRMMSFKLTQRQGLTVRNIIIFFAFIFFSNSFLTWAAIVKNVAADISKGEIKVMEDRDYSYKASFNSFMPLIRNCKGVLTLEHAFIGAFTEIPLDRIYDIWEIPPFGHFGDSTYKGLYPDRIDCILIFHELATGIGYATNYQIRYQNYIKPYAQYLRDRGAKVYDIEKFGQAVFY